MAILGLDIFSHPSLLLPLKAHSKPTQSPLKAHSKPTQSPLKAHSKPTQSPLKALDSVLRMHEWNKHGVFEGKYRLFLAFGNADPMHKKVWKLKGQLQNANNTMDAA